MEMLSLIYVLDIYAAIIQETQTKKFSVELSGSWRYARKISDDPSALFEYDQTACFYMHFRDINSGDKQYCCTTL